MYVPRLRERIPAQVRERASRAGFREPDWYAGPLVDDEFEAAPEDAVIEADDPFAELARADDVAVEPAPEDGEPDLKAELDEEIAEAEAKAAAESEMRARRPSWFSRLRRWAIPARHADAG